VTYAAPAITETFAAPAPVSYSTQTVAAPAVTYAAPAPAVTYAAAPIIEEVVVPNLLAMGNVISERVITIEELAANDRYAAAEAVEIAAPVVYETVAPAPVVYQTMTQAPVAYETIAQPSMVEYVTQAPMSQAFVQPTYATGMIGEQFTTIVG